MNAVGIITQARMTSTRLPGKVLLSAGGRTILDHHLDRLQSTGLPVVVATTVNESDDPIVALCAARGVDVFRGDEQDVLSRYAGASAAHGFDAVVRVTSDCPLIDPEIVLECVRLYGRLADARAHVSNVLERTYPRGFDVEVFSTAALVDADRRATLPEDREHVTPFLYSGRSGDVRLHAVTNRVDASAYRVTLDTPDDLVLIRTLIEEHSAAALDALQIIGLLESHPELVQLNAHVEQKKLGA